MSHAQLRLFWSCTINTFSVSDLPHTSEPPDTYPTPPPGAQLQCSRSAAAVAYCVSPAWELSSHPPVSPPCTGCQCRAVCSWICCCYIVADCIRVKSVLQCICLSQCAGGVLPSTSHSTLSPPTSGIWDGLWQIPPHPAHCSLSSSVDQVLHSLGCLYSGAPHCQRRGPS